MLSDGVIGAAIKVMKIATDEEPDDYRAHDAKDEAAQSLGSAVGRRALPCAQQETAKRNRTRAAQRCQD
jgi:hypothetical protein